MLARPGLPRFEYVAARAPDEVIRLLTEHGDAARLMMGGTDLLVRMRDGAFRPALVIDVKGLPGMRDVAYGADGLRVGAAVTMNELARHPAVLAHYPLLAESANSVASYQLRNRATIGGNLCNASPCADTSPATLIFEGRIVLTGPDGERDVSAANFFTGPGRTLRQANEIVTAIRFPPPPPSGIGTYLKLGRNKKGDLALVSVAVFGYRDASAPSGVRFRIALGAVAPVVLRVPEAEAILAADPPGEAAFARAADAAMDAATPINDVRASAAYRDEMVHNLTLRGLRAVWNTLGKGA
ncbi:MAG: xanthine dehydrogenase family protein subunit M [Anaerolineae bacterium]|nr:xanthine dehydrogenase family protein subunit M [Anaerolineae bacterium]